MNKHNEGICKEFAWNSQRVRNRTEFVGKIGKDFEYKSTGRVSKMSWKLIRKNCKDQVDQQTNTNPTKDEQRAGKCSFSSRKNTLLSMLGIFSSFYLFHFLDFRHLNSVFPQLTSRFASSVFNWIWMEFEG